MNNAFVIFCSLPLAQILSLLSILTGFKLRSHQKKTRQIELVSFLSFVDQSTFHGLHSSIFNSNHPIGALGRKIQARDKKGESQIQPLSQRHSTPSSAGCSVKQHFPGCQGSFFTLCAAHDLVSENLVK